MENDNELDKFIKRKNMRLTLINKGKKKENNTKINKKNQKKKKRIAEKKDIFIKNKMTK